MASKTNSEAAGGLTPWDRGFILPADKPWNLSVILRLVPAKNSSLLLGLLGWDVGE